MMVERVFVAREEELGRLERLLSRATAGDGQVCFVTGQAGSGKTSLIAEFARQAQEADPQLLFASGACNAQTGVGDPYLPFREVLAMLTGDVAQRQTSAENAGRLRQFLRFSGQALVEIGPDLIGIFVPGAGIAALAGTFVAEKVGWLDGLNKLSQRKAPAPGELEPGRIFEQYTGVLRQMAQRQPLIVVLDDLQWADAASLGLLFHLGRHLEGSRLLVIGAYRPEEVALGRGGERHPLEKVLTEFKRYRGEIEVDLDRIDDQQDRRFIDALLDREPNRLGSSFRQALFCQTGGHPLFTIELLRAMQERGDLVRAPDGGWVEGSHLDWETLPARVEGVIEERIGRLEAELADILAVASVEGLDFTAQVIARVEDRRERDLLRLLARELEGRHQLVQEQGEILAGRAPLSRYQFVHALFQQYVYQGLGSGERRLLHGEVATALEALYHESLETVTVQLARHYSQAGVSDKAIDYLLAAGDRARGLYAYSEAIDHYQRAMGLLRQRADLERGARTLMKLGLTHHLALDFRSARQAYEEGFALWQRAAKVAPPAAPPPAPHPLRIDWPFPPLTLDPTLALDIDSIGVIDQLYSGLLALTPEMDVVPDVAQQWEVKEDGRDYVFHLRDDVTWSDGEPVTAEDFAFAWRRVLDPALGSPAAGVLADIEQVEVPDARTLEVRLARPAGYFPHLMAYSVSFPVPRHRVEAVGEAWTEPANLVGNGPFRLAEASEEQGMVLARNPRYHGRLAGNVERVELRFGGDWDERLAAYEADRLDVLSLWDLRPERDQARQWHANEYLTGPAMSTLAIAFNLAQRPLDDARLRWALAQAVDRERLAEAVMHGYEFPAHGGFIPPGMPAHSADIGLPFDPEWARGFLEEAGHPGWAGLPPLTLLADRGRESLCQFLQDQWRQNLGVEVDWQTLDWESLMARLGDDPPELFLFAWAADYPDPDNFMRACEEIKRTGWSHPEYRRLLEQAGRSADQAERRQLYAQADRLLIDQAVIMPFTYGRLHLLVKPWLRRFATSAVKWWYWKDVLIEPH